MYACVCVCVEHMNFRYASSAVIYTNTSSSIIFNVIRAISRTLKRERGIKANSI